MVLVEVQRPAVLLHLAASRGAQQRRRLQQQEIVASRSAEQQCSDVTLALAVLLQGRPDVERARQPVCWASASGTG